MMWPLTVEDKVLQIKFNDFEFKDVLLADGVLYPGCLAISTGSTSPKLSFRTDTSTLPIWKANDEVRLVPKSQAQSATLPPEVEYPAVYWHRKLKKVKHVKDFLSHLLLILC